MVRIAIFCKTFRKGGAEKQALILAKLLIEGNMEVSLINWCGDQLDSGNLQYIEKHNIRYFGLRGSLLKKFFDYLRIIREEKVSVCLSYLTLPNFVSGISNLFVRNIFRIGGIRNEKLPYYKFIFERFVHNRLNDATVFNNYSAKAKFSKKGFKSGKIFVIHNAIEFQDLIVKAKAPSRNIRIISVCRFVRQKDLPTALYAIKELIGRNRDKNIYYYLIGYGPLEKRIRSMVKRLDIEEHVKILINPCDIYDILQGSDIYLSTSLFEGLSNSIMEAMSAGLPIVATNVGDNHYLVKDGWNGFLVPTKNANQLVEKLEYLLSSDKIRDEFGMKSYELIRNGFTQENLLKNYQELFAKIIPDK